MDVLARQIYWHAPVWEVLLALAAALLAIGWLVVRALRRPTVPDALGAFDPAMGELPLLFFDGPRGVRALSAAGDALLRETRPAAASSTDEALMEVVLEAYETAAEVRLPDWPDTGRTLVAVPVSARDGVVTGVLAIVASQVLERPSGAADEATTDAEAAAWVRLGPDLLAHRDLPIVRVRRGTERVGEGAPVWDEAHLSHTEGALLRDLMDHAGEVRPVEALFGVVWPDEAVDRMGLRPDQRDRLRRLVFQLRQSIEPEPGQPRYLRTAHGVGYALYGESAARER